MAGVGLAGNGSDGRTQAVGSTRNELMKKQPPSTVLRRQTLAVLGCALIAGCTSEVVRSSVTLAESSEHSQIELAESTDVDSSSRYSRELPANSVWELRGTIPQGKVYRRIDGIFTVEGTQIHEAYLVLSGDRVVGFYLPVERAYSPAREAVSLKIK